MNRLTLSQGLQVHWLLDRNKTSDSTEYQQVTEHLLAEMQRYPKYKLPSTEDVNLSKVRGHLTVTLCNLHAAMAAEGLGYMSLAPPFIVCCFEVMHLAI